MAARTEAACRTPLAGTDESQALSPETVPNVIQTVLMVSLVPGVPLPELAERQFKVHGMKPFSALPAVRPRT
jgi:hypothetical protein